MKKFTVEIDIENAAFEGGECCSEIARLLRKLAHSVQMSGACGHFITDINGNKVGFSVVKSDKGVKNER